MLSVYRVYMHNGPNHGWIDFTTTSAADAKLLAELDGNIVDRIDWLRYFGGL